MIKNPYIANLLNAVILIALGLTAYFTSDAEGMGKITALFGPIFGVIFLILHPWFKKHNKIVAHIVVVLTFLLLLALGGRLASAGFGNLFVVGSALSCAIALVIYILNFRYNRLQKQKEQS